MVLHVCQMCEDDPHFGAIKLNKILFTADFLAFVDRGRSITGQPYFKLEHGPAARWHVPLRDGMIKDGSLEIREVRVPFSEHRRHIPIALRPPRLELFDEDDLAAIRDAVAYFHDMTGKEASEVTHSWHLWKDAGMKEDIPYEWSLLSDRGPTPEEIAFASTLAARLPVALD
jgi:hypothetical protein